MAWKEEKFGRIKMFPKKSDSPEKSADMEGWLETEKGKFKIKIWKEQAINGNTYYSGYVATLTQTDEEQKDES